MLSKNKSLVNTNQKGSSLSLSPPSLPPSLKLWRIRKLRRAGAHPSSRTLRVHYGAGGRAGARATPFLAALFAKQKTKFGGGKTRAGKNSWWTLTLQPPSFLPARAKIIKSQRPAPKQSKARYGVKFSRKKVRILFRV